jgi:inosine-uridine nucleoside N-ribohydrolase
MKKIILDCDPGHDDMLAIILALSSNDLDVLGITTVAGNQTGEKTYINALRVLNLIGRSDVKVSRGFDKPILRELVTAPQIHGVSGLDGANLPEPKGNETHKHAVDFIIETVMSSPEKVYLVPTGPLTNVAVSLIKEPRLKDHIEKIVLMGGAFHDSNFTPGAEFNIYVDPEAAKLVFESGIPIVMVGLDVTNRALLTFEDIDYIESLGGKVSSVIAPLLRFFGKANNEFFGFDGAPIHDALAVSYLIDPTVLTLKHLHVDIETKGEFTSGQTVVDYYNVTKKEPNAYVALDLDLPKFKKLIIDAIKYFDNIA